MGRARPPRIPASASWVSTSGFAPWPCWQAASSNTAEPSLRGQRGTARRANRRSVGSRRLTSANGRVLRLTPRTYSMTSALTRPWTRSSRRDSVPTCRSTQRASPDDLEMGGGSITSVEKPGGGVWVFDATG